MLYGGRILAAPPTQSTHFKEGSVHLAQLAGGAKNVTAHVTALAKIRLRPLEDVANFMSQY